MADKELIQKKVKAELSCMADAAVLGAINLLLVEP